MKFFHRSSQQPSQIGLGFALASSALSRFVRLAAVSVTPQSKQVSEPTGSIEPPDCVSGVFIRQWPAVAEPARSARLPALGFQRRSIPDIGPHRRRFRRMGRIGGRMVRLSLWFASGGDSPRRCQFAPSAGSERTSLGTGSRYSSHSRCRSPSPTAQNQAVEQTGGSSFRELSLA